MAMKASTNKTNVVRKHPYTYVNMFFYRFEALRKIIKVYKTWMHSKVPRHEYPVYIPTCISKMGLSTQFAL